MKIKIKKLTETAQIPTKGTKHSAGWDLYADSKIIKDGIITYGTGLAIEIPKGYFGALFMRSSVSKMGIGFALKNAVGIIDSDYSGEIMFKYERPHFIIKIKNVESDKGMFLGTMFDSTTAPDNFEYQIGDKIGQLIILPYPKIEFEEVNELSDTQRGQGGFGSTNIKS